MVARRTRWSNPSGAEAVQRDVLASLMLKGARTRYGARYGMPHMRTYEDFASRVPLIQYEDIRPEAQRMVDGDRDILWPGVCQRFAQSSGTSGGKSKYIPVTADSLRLNHYPGASEAVASYLALYPDSRIFSGKGFILGGSFANELDSVPHGVCVGDLSANLIDAINPAVNLFRVPDKHTALMSDWSQKLPALIIASLDKNITNISGVPSWWLTVLRGVISAAGADNIHDVWPGLEVFFHGGISFSPYREQYRAITDTSKMRYIENYNASEGFFAVQDTRDGADGMRLLLDHGVFFEFKDLDSESIVPAWKVEQGMTYALVISACNGLWRYLPGDTVRIECVEPLRISIAGRTNSYINAFGEELMVWNADAALAAACEKTGAHVADYTAAPVYTSDRTKGHHQWIIEWAEAPACGNKNFADILDRELQKVNSDYQAKRSGDIFLAGLELTEAPHGTFNRWLASTGKLGGQRKVPRLSNDRRVVDRIIELINSKS